LKSVDLPTFGRPASTTSGSDRSTDQLPAFDNRPLRTAETGALGTHARGPVAGINGLRTSATTALTP
jgi:hypothetical protein